MAMKTSAVLRAAAERIGTFQEWRCDCDNAVNTCCCSAIFSVGDETIEAMKLFAKLYATPPEISFADYWWQHPRATDADQEARRLALLFAALIAEDEES